MHQQGNVTLDDVPRRIWDVWKHRDDGLIEAYDNTGRKHTFNRVATDIWDAIDGQSTVGDIVAGVQTRYLGDLPCRTALQQEVLALLHQLASLKMISFQETSLWRTD